VNVDDFPPPADPHTGPGGQVHPGNELDCPDCRAALLSAFHEPPGQPVRPVEPLPHLFPGPEHSRTVPLDPVRNIHTVWSRTEVHPYAPGGTWHAGCSCGWSKSGRFRESTWAPVAERLARNWAEHHLSNPLKGTEDQ
jgi:hypothetical protein